MKPDVRPRGTGPLIGGDRGTGGLRPPAPPPAAQPPAPASVTTSAPRQKLSPAEFNTAMVHFYRGEVQRANTWRNRLDTTTNWAVITAGATLSFAFSSAYNPHFVILINSLLILFFLSMEARRYRYYEIWSSRVRMMETGYFAQLLKSEGIKGEDWAELLAADLITPHFTISLWEALGRRLRRNYLWIFALLAASWNLKVYLHPTPARTFDDFVARATIGVMPGWAVLMIGVIFNAGIAIFAILTVRLRKATGEVLPQHEFSLHPFARMKDWTLAAASRRREVTLRRARRARARVRSSGAASTTTGEMKRPEQETVGKA